MTRSREIIGAGSIRISDSHTPTVFPPALYVHLPWCERKCPYCDFNSFEHRGSFDEDGYVSALLRDLDFEIAAVGSGMPPALGSIFIGGGTPSLFSGRAIRKLLREIAARATLAPDCEVTLEANPGSADAASFAEYRAAGVTRLSVGIQSFRNEPLERLGRVHGSTEAIQAIASVRDAGFDNFNLDLMYALPGDDAAGALADLETALATTPPHLSWYQLTLEPNTAFYRRPPVLPDETVVLEIETRGRALLEAAGLKRYEISAYAHHGFHCRHNLNYWRFGDYAGIGAGAHGKLTVGDGTIERRARTRNPLTYVATSGSEAAVASERIASTGDVVIEYLMNALRLTGGVTVAAFEAQTGRTVAQIADARAESVRRGWLDPDPGRLRATPAGLEVLNRVLELF